MKVEFLLEMLSKEVGNLHKGLLLRWEIIIGPFSIEHTAIINRGSVDMQYFI